MKSLLISMASFGLASLPLSAATGPLRDTALKLTESYHNSVVFLSAVVEIELSFGEEGPARKEERKLEVLATVIGKDGLIVAPLSTLDVASNIDGRTVNSPKGPVKISAKGSTKEVKILMTDGSEIPAKLVSKDPDLDLAFVRPEKPEEAAKLSPVLLSEHAPVALLDDVVILGRLNKELNREPVVFTSEVVSLIRKPRLFGKIGAQALGLPVFNRDGKFLGIGINRFSAKSDTESQAAAASTVLLPAEDLIEAASQVK